MGKPIEERMRRPGWYLDQFWHWLIGLVLSGGIASGLGYWAEWPVIPSVILGFMGSMLAGHIREFVQNFGDVPEIGSQDDSTLDLTFWDIGAALGPLALLWL